MNLVQAVSSFCMFPGTGVAMIWNEAGVPAGIQGGGAVAGVTVRFAS